MLDSLILSGRNRLTQVTAAVYLGMSLPDSVQEHAGSAPIWFTVGTRQVEMLHSCQHVDDLHLRVPSEGPGALALVDCTGFGSLQKCNTWGACAAGEKPTSSCQKLRQYFDTIWRRTTLLRGPPAGNEVMRWSCAQAGTTGLHANGCCWDLKVLVQESIITRSRAIAAASKTQLPPRRTR